MGTLTDLGYDLLGLDNIVYFLAGDPLPPPECGTASCANGCHDSCLACLSGCKIGSKN